MLLVVAAGEVALAHPGVDVGGGAATARRIGRGRGRRGATVTLAVGGVLVGGAAGDLAGRGGDVVSCGQLGVLVVEEGEVRAHAGDELGAGQAAVAGRESGLQDREHRGRLGRGEQPPGAGPAELLVGLLAGRDGVMAAVGPPVGRRRGHEERV